jgi:prepilin-type N-terminal cleavage/methylation domain-containing protein
MTAVMNVFKSQKVRWNTPESGSGFSLLEVLVVVGLSTVIAAIAVPMMQNTLGDFKLSGDARGLTNSVSLAKLRAASNFSQSRLFVDLNARSFHVETWRKIGVPAWVTEGGTTTLSTNDNFSFGLVGTAPPNTQAAIGQAAACVNDVGVAIGNTACILFNSRGIPVAQAGAPPAVGAPTGNNALYLTDGTAVYGVTLSATGLIRLWRTKPIAAPTWVLQ